MEERAYIDVNPSISILLLAIGLIEAWKLGQPWYLGLAVGILFGLLSMIGLVPVIGVVAYWFIGKWLMLSVIGVWFSWVFYGGLIFAVVYTIIMGIAVLVLLKR